MGKRTGSFGSSLQMAFTQQNLHMRYSSEVHTAPSNLVTSGRRMQSPSIVFFSWLLVQEKILTADKLQARNWPCNPMCLLCKIAPESALHICLQCPYAQHVWELVQSWSHDLVRKPDANSTIEDWWTDSLQSMPKEQRRTKAAILIYTVWNLWNERNRRTFQGKEAEPLMVLQLIKEEIGLRLRACGKPCVP